MSDTLRGVVVLGSVIDGRPMLIAAVTEDLLKRGLHAGQLVKQVAQMVGGGAADARRWPRPVEKTRTRCPKRLIRFLGLVKEALVH